MRLGIPLVLYPKAKGEMPALDISYQSRMLSLIKRGLSHENSVLFNKLYATNRMKNFATSVYFPRAKFEGKKIILGSDVNAILYLSTNDMELGLNFFNAFQWLKEKSPFDFNDVLQVRVGKIFNIPLPTIVHSCAVFKTMSPLVIRSKEGHFLSCASKEASPEFMNALITSVQAHASSSQIASMAEEMIFKPLKMKKTVMNPYGQFIEAGVGTFELTGNPLLLNEILNNGLGGKRGSFAGMLGLVREVNDHGN